MKTIKILAAVVLFATAGTVFARNVVWHDFLHQIEGNNVMTHIYKFDEKTEVCYVAVSRTTSTSGNGMVNLSNSISCLKK